MQPTNQLKRNKSKANLMQKFVDKFKKKPPPAKSRSKSPSKEQLSKKKLKSPSKVKHNAPQASKTAVSVFKEMKEVSAKGLKKEKDSGRKKKSGTQRKRSDTEHPAPSKSPSLVNIRQTESAEAIVHKEKVEKAVKAWMETLGKTDLKKVLDQEFRMLLAMKVDVEKCSVFDKNRDMCQSDNLEVLDANRVKAEGAEFFYHGSVVTVPNVTSKTVIVAQLPLRDDPESLESFWLMVAAHKIQRVFVILGPDELDKKGLAEYFPDDFAEYKTIRVNNRKTHPKSDEQANDQLYYEVVPKECAEAPFAMIEVCDFWTDAKIPTITGRAVVTAATVLESDIDQDASIGVVSNYGAGRSGTFLVGALAIEKLRSGDAPNMKEISTTVRSQRPGAVETLPQYTFSHILALSYSLKHVTNAALKTKIEKMIAQLEQFAFEKMAEEEDDEEDAEREKN